MDVEAISMIIAFITYLHSKSHSPTVTEFYAYAHGTFCLMDRSVFPQVSVTFSPERLGSYNQVWTVVDVKHSGKQVHRFTVFAKVSQGPDCAPKK